ncbi:MAG: alkaline phosphatase PhoX [Myxococcota bacterium]
MANSSSPFDRRGFLTLAAGSALGMMATTLSCRPAPTRLPRVNRLGPLTTHSGPALSLPKGFKYVIIQASGDPMSDGNRMPPQPDGMACFTDALGRLVLLRNQELGDAKFIKKWGAELMPYPNGVVPSPRHRDGVYGGVTRVVLDPAKLTRDFEQTPGKKSTSIVTSNLVLAGTDKNCAGGVIDGGWVSCEESSAPGHGYAFMTRPSDDTLTPPRRIEAWGRFQREAVAQEPKTGVIYMTEDHADAVFYRFVPDTPSAPTGKGRVEALVIDGVPHTHPYTHSQGSTPVPLHWPQKKTWEARWIPVPDPAAKDEPCREQAARLGATRFHRTEGITVDASGVWFVASTAGCSHGGQLFRYAPKTAKTGQLILEHEVQDRTLLSSPDNIVMTPWGELLLAEDNYETGGGVVTHQYLRVMNAKGEIADFARNNESRRKRSAPGSEFTGACFSPDGRTLFVNLQTPTHLTVAITGPWPTA